MIEGTFYNQFPELKELAIEELSNILKSESERLTGIKSGVLNPVNVPVLKKGEKPKVVNGHFEQNVVWPDGKVENRPIFLFGFGVFDQMRNDVNFLGQLGINYSQSEIGPSHIFPEEGKFEKKRIASIQKFLKRSEELGIFTDLLLSPHYVPQWFHDKNPGTYIHLGGFLRIGINRPAIEKFLDECYSKILPDFAQDPALFSICVTNEPVAFVWSGDKDTHRLWEEYLVEKYKTTSKLNNTWGTSYKNFLDIKPILVPPKVPFEFDPRLYDWTDFNAQRLAKWIGSFGKIAEKYAPGIPQHTKMIQRSFAQYDLMQGVDPYYFTQNGDMNGFDGGVVFRDPIRAFNRIATVQAMIKGARTAPLLNTEHHLLRDRNHDAVPAGFVRAAFFHQALEGLSASVAWNWDYDGSDHNTIFAGLFRYRPGATEEYVGTGLDLMRLAPEVVAISEQQPEVGILYSRANMLWNQDSIDKFYNCNAALSANGITAVAIPDQIVAKGELKERFPNLKVLILPDVKYLPDEVFVQLDVFAKTSFHENRGVVAIDSLPEFSPYHKRRDVSDFYDTAVMTDFVKSSNLNQKDMANIIGKFGVKPEVKLLGENGEIAEGVYFRFARKEGKLIGVAINLNSKPVTVKWQSNKQKTKNFTDFANGNAKFLGAEFEIAPWEVKIGYIE